MRARFIKQIGMRGKLRVFWDTIECTSIDKDDGYAHTKYLDTCPNSYGANHPGIHNAYTPIGDKPDLENFRVFGEKTDYPTEMWPTRCADCGAPIPEPSSKLTQVGEKGFYVVRQVFSSRLYDNQSGEPEPGDIFRMHYHDPKDCCYWDNCDGTHLFGVLPTGYQWDMDSRASNCTLPNERAHRCWTKTGSPEAGTLDVGKGGHTCAAGAGSIDAPGWHGFLRNFTWVK
jgi:hypothetical protein